MVTPAYLVKYNDYTLPGFAQQESIDSVLNIADHYAAYVDGSNSEDTGLSNKALTVAMKVWEQDYMTCKDQVRLAATMARSTRTFAPLYIGYTDKHYMAMTKSITTQKDAGTSVKTLDYSVEFECKPWLIGEVERELTGTGTIDTDQVSRSISNGGFSPTTVTVTGTDVTISGYTSTGEFTGYVAISGAVAGLIIDSEAFSAYQGETNMNSSMITVDYRLNVGPGKTYFAITGASVCSIKYYDRWYL